MKVLWVLLDKKEEGPNLEVAGRAVCKSAAERLFHNFPHGGDGVAPATCQLLELSRRTVVSYVPNSAVYEPDDEAKNDALWIAITGHMTEASIALFNEALIANLSRVVRHDVWSRTVEDALRALADLAQMMGSNSEDYDGRH